MSPPRPPVRGAAEALAAVCRQRASLSHTDHRPFPLPRGPGVMGQGSIDLLLAHWPVPESALRPAVPAGVPIDTFQVSAWIGITPFEDWAPTRAPFTGALSFAASPCDVVARRLVTARVGDDRAVQRGVDLTVAALVESLALGVARAGGDRCDARRASQLGGCREALRAGDLADELGGDQRAESRLGEQLRRDLPDELGDLALEAVDELDAMMDEAFTMVAPRAAGPARVRSRAAGKDSRPSCSAARATLSASIASD